MSDSEVIEVPEILRKLKERNRRDISRTVPIAIALLGVFLLVLFITYRFIITRLSDVEALTRIAAVEQLWRDSKNLDLTIQEYKDLASRFPKTEILTRLAGLLIEKGDLKGAENWLAKAHGSSPNDSRVHSTEMYLYIKKGDINAAVRAGERALQLNPNDAESFNNLAWLAAKSDKPDPRSLNEALARAETAVRLTGQRNPSYLDTLAEVHFRRQEYSKAIAVIEAAIETDAKQARYLAGQRQRFKAAADAADTTNSTTR